MIAVIFEVWPKRERKKHYLDIAAQLRPILEKIDGFISIERFESLTEPGKILSLSFFRDEAAVQAWRATNQHLSFPKILSDLNWHDEVESLHRQWRCLRSFMHSGCSSPICSSRVLGLKPRTSFSVTS